MSRRSMKSVHHEPDDPDIAVAMRARREELGLSIQEMARYAEVSEQSWRNYEQGRTRVREDKQPAVWRALGWEWPNARSGPAWLDAPELLGLLDSDDEEAIRRVLENPETLDAVMRGAGGRLGLPEWDDIPSALGRTAHRCSWRPSARTLRAASPSAPIPAIAPSPRTWRASPNCPEEPTSANSWRTTSDRPFPSCG